MATTWQTTTVRVNRPHELSLGEFFADMRSWLDHHCIMLADFTGKNDVLDVQFTTRGTLAFSNGGSRLSRRTAVPRISLRARQSAPPPPR